MDFEFGDRVQFDMSRIVSAHPDLIREAVVIEGIFIGQRDRKYRGEIESTYYIAIDRANHSKTGMMCGWEPERPFKIDTSDRMGLMGLRKKES